jgi:hypothetical protein
MVCLAPALASVLPTGVPAAAAVGTRLGASVAGLSFRVHDVTQRQTSTVAKVPARIVGDDDRIDVGRSE